MFDALQRLGNLSARFSSVYSHIHRLRLDDRLEPRANSQEMVAWAKAREAAGMVLKTVHDGWIAGRVMLFSGSPPTGKTVIALSMAQTLGSDIPFTVIAASASEVFSLSMSKTEAYRRNIGIHIKEGTELVKGEEVEIQLTGGESPSRRHPYHKSLTLLTIDKTSGKSLNSIVCLHGREIMMLQALIPEDEIQKWGEIVHTVSLHEIDVINSRTQGFPALFACDMGEIKQEVLFIDAVHMSDTERLSLLNRALENDLATLASNRGMARIRGTIFCNPHGSPFNLLDHVLIVNTKLYSEDNIEQIIQCGMELQDTFCMQVPDESTGAKKRMSPLK
ncbi:TIP49 C-terminus-domain-containing protein [Armillaria borealis]|uniref:RuvB-like helicase n=1 Tax=Armillaria borealis TaxID=47425 RepID=A0AA39ISJ1_9AGAR|nr:TIP49 C-terminus-domain-containing protein [Armillaria borealis]